MANSITTIKLNRETKARIEKLREHKRETYDDILRKMLGILNIAKIEPEKARGILIGIDQRKTKINPNKTKKKAESNLS